jgi:hypothetical protein
MYTVDIDAKNRNTDFLRIHQYWEKIFGKDFIGNAVVCQIFAGSCDIHPIVLISTSQKHMVD